MTYETVSRFVQQAGTVYFVLMFVAAFAYALWPRKQAEFDKAARTALDEEDRP